MRLFLTSRAQKGIQMIASFNMQAVKKHATQHNSRKHAPHYLLIHNCENNEFKAYISDRKAHLEKAEKLVKDKTGRAMQASSKDTFWQEAVINIMPNTSLIDIENLFKALNKEHKGGFEVSEIAIHKDEGVFLDTTLKASDLWFNSTKKEWVHKATGKNVSHRVIAYSPNQDIHYDKKTKEWYFDKEYTKKAPRMQMYFNNHAHAIFNRLNWKTGKMVRLSKKDMTKIQDLTAEHLKMVRGKSKSITNSQRRNPHQLKQEYKYDNDLKRQHIQEIQQLRAELQKNNGTREDYAKLEQLNRELKEQIKSKDLTIESLQKQLEAHKYSNTYTNGTRKLTKDEVIDYLEQKNGELEKEISTLKNDLELAQNHVNSYLGLNRELNHELSKLKTKLEKLDKESNFMKYEEVIKGDTKLSDTSINNSEKSVNKNFNS